MRRVLGPALVIAALSAAVGCGCQAEPAAQSDPGTQQSAPAAQPAPATGQQPGSTAAPGLSTPGGGGDSELQVNPNANFGKGPGSAGG